MLEFDTFYQKPTKGGRFSLLSRQKDSVEFDTPSLIITSKGAQTRNRFLKYDVTPQAILEFVQKNRHLLNQDRNGDLIFDDKTPLEKRPKSLYYEAHLEKLIRRDIDVRIVEFDDQFNSEELVYGITRDV